MANAVDSFHLVVVHLSQRLPKYLISNLVHLHSMFPKVQKTLVISQGVRVKPGAQVGWSVYEYERSDETEVLFSKGKLDPTFRKGFWYVTLERLLALEEIHLKFPHEPLLHVESDVYLMPTFPIWFFSKMKTLAWQKVDSKEDVASLVFSPSATKTSLLCRHIRAAYRNDPTLSDMRALRQFASEHPDEISYLGMSPETAGPEGLFDPATAGIYLTGNDPRNSRGIERYGQKLSPQHLMNVESFEWQITNNSISCRTKGAEWAQLQSLHIHSKRPSFFYLPNLLSQAKKVASGQARTRFSSSAFLAWIGDIARDILRVSSIKKVSKRVLGLAGVNGSEPN